MSAVAELPLVEPELTAPDDLGHIVCCDEDVALCGKDVSAEAWDFGPIDETKDCEICVNKSRLNPGCPRCNP